MRVIAGRKKRYGLKTTKGTAQRPTTDRIKETLFNLLQDEIEGCFFVDLCAGCGQIGIEALSRGAEYAYFIEQDKAAIKVIKENLDHTGLMSEANVIQTSLPSGVKRIKFNDRRWIVFLDPPYQSNLAKEILTAFTECDFPNDTLFIAEAEKNTDFSFVRDLGMNIEREKIYKNNKHVFIRRVR